MRYVIISDLQGNLESIEMFAKCMDGFSRDDIIFLGDAVADGSNYKENRAVDILRKLDVKSVRGNHEERLKGKKGLKVVSPSLEFLLGLEEKLKIDNVLCFHSSFSNPGKRLVSLKDIQEEARYVSGNYPGCSYVLFGHSHKAGVFFYNKEKDAIESYDLRKKIKLKKDGLHLINPGGLGLYY